MAGYLGDKSTMVVHHLANMKKECKINEIKKLDRVYFTPDSLDEAKRKLFVPCKNCSC